MPRWAARVWYGTIIDVRLLNKWMFSALDWLRVSGAEELGRTSWHRNESIDVTNISISSSDGRVEAIYNQRHRRAIWSNLGVNGDGLSVGCVMGFCWIVKIENRFNFRFSRELVESCDWNLGDQLRAGIWCKGQKSFAGVCRILERPLLFAWLQRYLVEKNQTPN